MMKNVMIVLSVKRILQMNVLVNMIKIGMGGKDVMLKDVIAKLTGKNNANRIIPK